MNVRGLLQVGLGLLGVQAFFQAVISSSILVSLAGAGALPGLGGLRLMHILQVVVLFVASYALVIHNHSLARAFEARAGLADASIGAVDLRPVIVGLFGLSVLLHTLPSLVQAIGAFFLQAPGAVHPDSQRLTGSAFLVLGLELATALLLIARPTRVLELWESGESVQPGAA